MNRKCRIWWPKHLSSAQPSSYNFLLGWFVSCSSASLDIVVAFASIDILLPRCQSGFQDILHNANRKMPVFLEDKSTFSFLGQCVSYLGSNGQYSRDGMEGDDQRESSIHGIASALKKQNTIRENCGRWSCGCHKLDGLSEQYRQASICASHWILVVPDLHEHNGREVHWIPRLHHIHWRGQIVSQCDVHVIVYETPLFGVNHFSPSFWNSSKEVKPPLKTPKWVDELYQKQPRTDLDTVILAINSSAAARIAFNQHMGSKRSFDRFLVITWHLFAIFIASFSTFFYIILQFAHSLLSFGSQTWICIMSSKVFSTAWTNIRIRCCQILYWPVFLQDSDLRSPCVEYAEKAALQKHSVWSSLAFDVLLGNLVGLTLLFHAESVCLWVFDLASGVTNELLRTGCVWLMGVPAGFKLNTELAGVLGMISLNAIQIWSTLWNFIGFLLIYFIKGLAMLGILFGMTIPAALIIDLILLATFHVSTLHWLISLLYSQQIQALAALWRLFRGRKWNPLRQRLDSYDYTVEQHIVGSLMFAPLLLLLPTTSVFYIFFTIMNATISLICMVIEVSISVIHATPYIKIFLWLVNQRRFPSGIWFDTVSCQSNSIVSPDAASLDETSLPPESSMQNNGKSSSLLVSALRSNSLSIGQVIKPHYRKVFSGVSGSFFTTSAYEVLTGKRIASSLGTGLPSMMPWMAIPCKEYWCLCRNSILACMADHEHHAGQRFSTTY